MKDVFFFSFFVPRLSTLDMHATTMYTNRHHIVPSQSNRSVFQLWFHALLTFPFDLFFSPTGSPIRFKSVLSRWSMWRKRYQLKNDARRLAVPIATLA